MAHPPRHLHESYISSTPLNVDREAGVIHRVRILGPVSKNTYGERGVEATEYPVSAHDSCRALYEGKVCNLNHVKDKTSTRMVQEAFGKFKNVVTVNETTGPVTYGDLHYFKSHDMANRVCEDVERGLGVFGLSHDAFVGRERIDRTRKRLVIESISKVKSIDLVQDAATNRNLRESQEQPIMKTLKATLESLSLPPGKTKWARRLIEDTELRNVLESEGDSLAAGFETAIATLASEPAITATDKAKRIGRLLETQERLDATADSEPAPPVEGRNVNEGTEELAAIKAENAALKQIETVRRLCESEKFFPSELHLKTLAALSTEVERKALIADLKPKAAPASGGPRSGFSRNVTESNTDANYQPAKDAKEFAQRIRG